MKLVGLMPIRNEAWCVGLTLRAALLWCDSMVVLLHACTDHSRDIVYDVVQEHERGRVIVLVEPDEKWDEMRHRQMMLDYARAAGATHMAIVDADEVLTSNLLPRSTGAGDLSAGGMLQLPGFYVRGAIDRYHANGVWGRRWFDVAFTDAPLAHWDGDRFHNRAPIGVTWIPYRPIEQSQGGVIHLWGASERRLRAKHALYKMVERLRFPNKPLHQIENMYNLAIYGSPTNDNYGTPATWVYSRMPLKWLEGYGHLMKHLDIDATPWQEATCQWIVTHYGRDLFAGLDLFGVVA